MTKDSLTLLFCQSRWRLPTKNPRSPSFTQKSYLHPDFVPHHLNKISQESIILGGGAAAILLQVANPSVGAGVHEHSNFAHRVPDRLRSTMTYIYCMSFGTPREKQQLADLITRVHADVRGTLTEGPDRGKEYTALDPHLQLWVAATLYATAVDVYQRVFPHGIADDAEHERIYAEYAVLACALQVPPGLWPQTRADFWAYWDRQAPWYLRLFLPAVRVVTAEWLPPRLRAEYGCKRHRTVYKFMEKTVRAIYPALPTRFRTWPVRFYLSDMRKRMAKNHAVVGKEA
ncbi:hypothetical protein PG997_005369 [Apiospora hydei]|uniref:ER-bound oxygenase mpaB/mpaB'/Rubber oxygenase catalytic domain-containing protein n=1 Tax=Apiospora hydei TaxID=1337664 RepID=A0ABR1X4S5_9PEZI